MYFDKAGHYFCYFGTYITIVPKPMSVYNIFDLKLIDLSTLLHYMSNVFGCITENQY